MALTTSRPPGDPDGDRVAVIAGATGLSLRDRWPEREQALGHGVVPGVRANLGRSVIGRFERELAPSKGAGRVVWAAAAVDRTKAGAP